MSESAKGTAAEVKVKLVLDSNAKAVADEVSHGLAKVEGAQKKAASKIDTTLKGNLGSLKALAVSGAGAVAAATVAAGAGIIGLAVKSYHAWGEAASQIKEIAGALAVVDQNQNSFKSLFDLGEDVKGMMEDVGIKAGVSADKTVSAFNNIIEHGGKTVDEVSALVEEMAMAGKVIPGGLDAVASGYEQIQMGMVRAKNPLVQLISATGTLKGSAKAVAKEMQKLSIDEQMKLAEKALGKVSEKMKAVPLSIGGMKEGIGIVVSNIFENAGKPITNALKPAFGRVHGWITGNQDALYAMGESFGNMVAKGLELVDPILDELGKAVRENWDEIKSAFDAVYGPGKELFEYIYEHKGEFAKTIGDVARVMIKAASWLVKALAAVRDVVVKVAGFLGKNIGDLATGGEFSRMRRDEAVADETKNVRATVMASGWRDPTMEAKEKAKQKYLEAFDASSAEEQAAAVKQFDSVWDRAYQDHRATMSAVQGKEAAARLADTDSFVQAWKVAYKAQDAGAMAYVAHFLDSSKTLQKALGEDGPRILGEGFKTLLATLKSEGDKDALEGITKAGKANLGTPSKTSITQNFNGPIHVKQDFRDQDPDRVAVVFREDMAKVGTNRLQSRFAPPFSF